MTAYAVTILTDFRTPHIHCFSETASAVARVLIDLGHDVTMRFGIPSAVSRARNIIFNAHMAINLGLQLPPDTIVFQMEQIGSSWITPEVVSLFNDHEIWEYSAANARNYAAIGLKQPAIVPFGKHHVFERFSPLPMKDRTYDIVHFGALSRRRIEVLQRCIDAGLNVRQVSCAYGLERDLALTQAKLVLNVHHYETASIFESARVGYCAANNVPVLSETSARGEGTGFAEFADHEKLASTAIALVEDEARLEFIRARAQETYNATSFYDNVVRALNG